MTTKQRNWIKDAGKVHRIVEALEESASWYGGDESNVRRIIKGDGGELQSGIGRLLAGYGRATSYIVDNEREYIYELIGNFVIAVTINRGPLWVTILCGDLVQDAGNTISGRVLEIEHPHSSDRGLVKVHWNGTRDIVGVKAKHLNLDDLLRRELTAVMPRTQPNQASHVMEPCESIGRMVRTFSTTANRSRHGHTCPQCGDNYQILETYTQQLDARFRAIIQADNPQSMPPFKLTDFKKVEVFTSANLTGKEPEFHTLNASQRLYLEECLNRGAGILSIKRIFPIWQAGTALIGFNLSTGNSEDESQLQGLLSKESALISRYPMSPTERLVNLLKQRGALLDNSF